MEWVLAAIIILLLLYGHEKIKPIDKKWMASRKIKLPPGPKGLPVVGNLLQFWKARDSGSMVTYLLSLGNFGEMTTLHMGSQLWVLINTDRVAQEIINMRATITNERPHMPISSGLVSNNKRSVIQKTATWNEGRRLTRHLLTSPIAKRFIEWQDLESVQMLLSYVQKPKDWYLHQSRYSTAIINGVITGDRLAKTDEQLEEYRRVTMEFLGSLFSTTVDFFPMLELLPKVLQFWRPRWEAVGKSHRRIFKEWWGPIKTAVENGTAKASWVRDVLLNPDTRFKGGNEEAMYLTNSLIQAGGDNTRMALNTFIMASIHCPEKFKKSRQEIDTICGTNANRLPDVGDISSMPYLCAFVKETLRWRPVIPLIPPHRLTEELKYEGFVFPKDTNFIVNTIAVSANCDEPEAFQPERWIDGNEANLTQGFWGFGGGRRICIGYKAVQPALFLAISRLIYCFDFEPNGSYDSKRINNHWSGRAEPFPVHVSKRSLEHEHLIRKEATARGL